MIPERRSIPSLSILQSVTLSFPAIASKKLINLGSVLNLVPVRFGF